MKSMKLLSLSVLCMILASCVDHEAETASFREQIVSEGVRIRISEFRQREWDKCLEQARDLAIANADSMIRAMAKQEAVEPVQKPPKPERPVKPEVRILPDSVMRKASVKKDSIQD